MARLSQARGGQAARAMKPKPPVKRAAVRDKAAKVAAASAGPDLRQPVETGSAVPPAPEVTASPPPLPEAAWSPAATPRPPETGAPPAVAEPTPEVEPVAAPALAPAGEAASPPPDTAQPPDLTAMLRASRTLVEGPIRVRSQMIGFGCRQAEHGFAFGRALLAGGSLPEILALQANYLGRTVDDALVQILEFSRLSTDVVRAGLESLRPR